MNDFNTRAGYVAILGRPNVGKSTLLNNILGKKVSITARRAQTTRHRILGIKSADDCQTIYVDTPGIHSNKDSQLNDYMNKTALGVLNDVDIIIFMVVGTVWHEEDEFVLKALKKISCPVILVINKVDLVAKKSFLLGHIEKITKKFNFISVLPISAKDSTNVSNLEKVISELLPENPFFFPVTSHTDRDEKFLISEVIREKLTRLLGQELPYSVAVVVDSIKRESKLVSVSATIYVERRGQKVIVVGKEGVMLKEIGTLARYDMEDFFDCKVFLQLWVKIKPGWTNDKNLLSRLGYKN